MRSRACQYTIFLCLIAVLGALTASTARSQEVVMPNVIGMRPEAARDTLMRLRLGEVTLRDSLLDSEPGFVIAQVPEPDIEVAVGEPVRLSVSASNEPEEHLVEVPNVLERNVDEAIEILTEARLLRGELTPVPSDVELGVVLRQNPGPGELVQPGTPVHLAVSAGEDATLRSVMVPDVIGRGIEEAEEMIVEARLAVGRVSARGRGLEGSQVVRQEPPPGTGVRPGTPVNLVLAAPESPPTPFPWPPVIGGLLIFLAVAFYLVARPRRARGKASGTGGRMKLKTARGTEVHKVSTDHPVISGPEVSLRPVSDPGTQEIEVQGPLTGDERRGNG